jgi:uncharacterized membrane protein
MLELPSIPSWNALHPGISHFPIVLLLVAPVLLLIGVISEKRRAEMLSMALWFLIVGTIFIYLSAATGDSAKELAPKTPEVVKAVENHENMGSMARAVFTVLAVLLSALCYAPRLLKKELSPKMFVALAVILLLLYVVAAMFLFDAAHSGGLLVHKFGVHAKIV